MTQFLTRLAARALELTPTVQPQIASRFDADFGQPGLESEREVSVTETSRMPRSSEAGQPLLVDVDRPSLAGASLLPKAIAHAPRAVSPQLSNLINSPEIVELNRDIATSPNSLPVSPPQPLPSILASSEPLERSPNPLEPPLAHFGAPSFNASENPAVPPLESLLPELNAPQSASAPIQPRTTPPEIAVSAPAATLNGPNPQIIVQRSLAQTPQPAISSESFIQPNLATSPPQPTSIEQIEVQTVVDRQTSREIVTMNRERNREVRFVQSAPLKESLVSPRSAEMLLPPVVPAKTRLAANPQPRETPAAPTPTIHITIGRIDVRAVAPPAPARSRSAAQPVRMTLDDYLRSRNGGRS